MREYSNAYFTLNGTNRKIRIHRQTETQIKTGIGSFIKDKKGIFRWSVMPLFIFLK